MRFPSLRPSSLARTPARIRSAIHSAAGLAHNGHWSARPALLTLGLAALMGCGDASPPLSTDQQSARAVVPAAKFYAAPNAVEGSYIVVTEGGSDPRSVAAVAGVNPRFVYTTALSGFAASLNSGQLTALLHNPRVRYIEQDQAGTLDATQSNPTWGLDRVDQRGLPLDYQYTYSLTSQKVNVYVVDTGIRTDHTQFGWRAYVGYDATGGNGQDCSGHGTHVAGTIGAATYGVAKTVTIVGVRVVKCSGEWDKSQVLAGIDWVTRYAQKPAVANISLGFQPWEAPGLDEAVANLINSGVVAVVSAGNENQDACNKTPARVAAAITVGATHSNDARAVFSNFGSCVDLFAPGVDILSAGIQSATDDDVRSGTSMAAPHVAGLAALYLQTKPSASPAAVAWALTRAASTGKIITPGTNSPNRLAYLLNPPSGCGRLLPGEALRRDQFVNVELKSCNGQALLALQTDQNVVLYDRLGPRWAASNTLNRGTMVLQMQPDGNLVAYAVPTFDGQWQPLWSSNTQGSLNAWLAIQDDCNMVIYRGPYPQGGPIWATNTFCR